MTSMPRNQSPELVAHYEQLRSEALFQSTRRHPAPGLALLLGRGMTEWMRAWSACLPKLEAETLLPSALSPPCPLEVRAQIATLLAGIILSQQLEVTR